MVHASNVGSVWPRPTGRQPTFCTEIQWPFRSKTVVRSGAGDMDRAHGRNPCRVQSRAVDESCKAGGVSGSTGVRIVVEVDVAVLARPPRGRKTLGPRLEGG